MTGATMPHTPKTSSPGMNSVTLLPTASTTPAISAPFPGVLGLKNPSARRAMNGSPRILCQSKGFAAAAYTLTSTWLSFGVGFSTSTNCSMSGDPYSVISMTFIGVLPIGDLYRWLHRNDYFSYGVTFPMIPKRFWHFLQRESPVDHRMDLASLAQPGHKEHILDFWTHRQHADRFVLSLADAGPQQQHLEKGCHRTAYQIGFSIWSQCPPVVKHGADRHQVQNKIVTLSVFAEILARVIYDGVSAQPTQHIQLLRIVHAGDFRPIHFGQLHRECSRSAARAVDQHLLPGLHLSLVANTLQGNHRPLRKRRRFLESQIGGL